MRKLMIIPLLMAMITACEDDDSACTDVICVNGGTCVNGACDCPVQWTGPDCSNQVKPAAIRLQSIKVIDFPITDEGGDIWDDVFDPMPDIFPVISNDDNTETLYSFDGKEKMETTPTNGPHLFEFPGGGWRLPDVDARYNIALYDWDWSLDHDVMGGMNLPLYYNTNAFPDTIDAEYGEYRFKIAVTYTW